MFFFFFRRRRCGFSLRYAEAGTLPSLAIVGGNSIVRRGIWAGLWPVALSRWGRISNQPTPAAHLKICQKNLKRENTRTPVAREAAVTIVWVAISGATVTYAKSLVGGIYEWSSTQIWLVQRNDDNGLLIHDDMRGCRAFRLRSLCVRVSA